MIIHLLKEIYTGGSYRIDIAQQNKNVFEDDLIKYSIAVSIIKSCPINSRGITEET